MTADFDSFPARVFQVLAAIPPGKVTTYGVVAQLAGAPRHARHVGRILYHLPEGSRLPWFRVLNRQGRISLTGADYQRQKQCLLKEGITFAADDRVSLKIYGWWGD